MADYHNTSSLNQPSQPPKKLEPPKKVVKDSAQIAKKGFLKQMAQDLFVTDGKTVAQSVRDNVIMPTIKKLILDIAWNSLTTALYDRHGGAAPINTYSNPSYAPNYGTANAYWGSQRQAVAPANAPSITNIQSMYESIYFYNKDDPDPMQQAARNSAQTVLNEMIYRVKQCGRVSVSDLYTLAGVPISNSNYILDRWQWRNLDEGNAYIVPHPNGGFGLDLPKPQYY